MANEQVAEGTVVGSQPLVERPTGISWLNTRHATVVMVLGVLVISFIAWRPLTQQAFPLTWDGDLHVIRTLHLERELIAGQFPVRWGSEQNGGYGYPTFNFYYQFPYYAAVALHQTGMSAGWAVKVVVALSLIVSGLFTAMWVRSVWGPVGGLVAGALTILAPVVLQTVYLVFAYGELVSISLYPGILWAVHSAESNRRWRLSLYVVVGLLLGLCVLSHNLFGIFAVAMTGGYGLMLALTDRRWGPIVGVIGATVIALGLTSYFWLPGVAELTYTYSVRPIEIRFPPPLELIDISLGTPTTVDRVIFRHVFPRDTLGPAVVGSLILGVASLVAFRHRMTRRQVGNLAFCLFAALGISVLMIMPFRKEVWENLPLLEHAQYASRLLLLVGFTGAAAAGTIEVWSKWKLPIAGTLLLIALVYGVVYSKTYNTQPIDDSYYRHYWQQWLGAADWGAPIMPRWNQVGELAATRTVATLDGGGEILDAQKQSISSYATVRANTPSVVRFTTLYFPGWKATVDGVEVPITIKSDDGTIGVPVGAGQHEVSIRFTDTLVRRIGNISSLISIALTAAIAAACTVLAIRRRPDRS